MKRPNKDAPLLELVREALRVFLVKLVFRFSSGIFFGLGVVTFCWTPVSLFFDYAMSPSSRLRLAMLVPKASLIRSLNIRSF